MHPPSMGGRPLACLLCEADSLQHWVNVQGWPAHALDMGMDNACFCIPLKRFQSACRWHPLVRVQSPLGTGGPIKSASVRDAGHCRFWQNRHLPCALLVVAQLYGQHVQ